MKNSIPLYLTNTLRAFSLSIIGLYIPIYLFDISKSFVFLKGDNVINGVFIVLLYYLVVSTTTLVLMPSLVDMIFGWFKFKGSITASNIMLGISLYMLIIGEHNLFFILFSAVFLSMNTILYWIPYHTFFLRNIPEKDTHIGSKTGMRIFLASIATAGGPAIGGIILKLFGFNALFIAGIFVLILSGIPLFFSKQEHKHGKHSVMRIVKRYMTSGNYNYTTLAQMCNAVDGEVFAMFSPLLLYTYATDVTFVGFISSISIGVGSVFSLVIGKIIDKKGPRNVQKIGFLFNSIFYIPRAFTRSFWILSGIDIMDRINGSLLSVPLLSATYENARKEENESDYMIYREFVIHIGLCIAIVFIMTVVLTTYSWKFIFILLSLVSPFAYLVNYKVPLIKRVKNSIQSIREEIYQGAKPEYMKTVLSDKEIT